MASPKAGAADSRARRSSAAAVSACRLGLRDLGFERADGFVAFGDGAQAGRIAIPDGDKFRQVCGPVFLAEGVDAVQPVADPLQSGGIGFDALAFGGGRGAQVLEFQYDRPQPVGDLRGGGAACAQVPESRLRIAEPHEHPPFVLVECIAELGEGLADAVGIFQQGQFGFQGRLLAVVQVGARQFLHLVLQPLLVAATLLGFGAQGGEFPTERMQPVVQRPVAGERVARAGERVERPQAELFRRKDEVLVLRVDVYELCAQRLERGELHGRVIDESPAFARRGDLPRDEGDGFVIQVVSGEKLLQFQSREIECSFDQTVAGVVLDRRSVAAAAQQQSEGPQQDRLSRTRLPREDVQVWIEFQFERLDQGVILDFEALEHVSEADFRFYRRCVRRLRFCTSGAAPRLPTGRAESPCWCRPGIRLPGLAAS